jgi:hypothetical protein
VELGGEYGASARLFPFRHLNFIQRPFNPLTCRPPLPEWRPGMSAARKKEVIADADAAFALAASEPWITFNPGGFAPRM